MRIAIISSKRKRAGVTSWNRIIAKELTLRGFEVYIFARKGTEATEALKIPGVHLKEMSFGFDLNPLTFLKFWIWFRIKRIDAVITNLRKEIFSGGIGANIAGIPHIRRIGSHIDVNNRLLNRWAQKYSIDHNIVPCKFVLDEILKKFPEYNPDDFSVIYNGREPATIQPEIRASRRKEWGVKPDELVIGYVNQLKRAKGPITLLKAASLLKGKPIKFVLVGSGPDEMMLKEMVNSSGIQDHVIFTGFSSAVPEDMAGFDIGVLPSFSEGFPNVLIEMMSLGLPVIATKVGGIPEAIRHGENGLLFEPGDAKELAKLIDQLITHKEVRDILGKEAKQTVIHHFSRARMIRDLELLLFELVDGKK
ncbi:MAG: hypothetical protein Kow00108_23220 [Calditrichia bacterium]